MGLFGPPNGEKLKEKRDLKGLVKALQYRDSGYIRRIAAEALGQIGDTQAVEPLITALKKPWDYDVRRAAPAALRDKDKDVRKAAIEALAKIGDACAVEPLCAALKDSVGDSAGFNIEGAAAAGALEKIGVPDDPAIKAGIAVGERDWAGAVSFGAPAVEPLLAALRDEDKWVREALENIQEAIRGYLASLKKHDEPVPPPVEEEVVEVGI